MAKQIIRAEAGIKCSREPDIFLSHSSKDKDIVRHIAADLGLLEVDAWLDEWEIAPADSLYDAISAAMEKSRFIGVIVTENFAKSRWTSDELKQALARERRNDKNIVIPLVFGRTDIPSFLEDKKYLDFRDYYYSSLVRLAGLIHGVSQLRIEKAIYHTMPNGMPAALQAMRYMGIEPYMIVGQDDFDELLACGATPYRDNRLRLNSEKILANPGASPHIKDLVSYFLTRNNSDTNEPLDFNDSSSSRLLSED